MMFDSEQTIHFLIENNLVFGIATNFRWSSLNAASVVVAAAAATSCLVKFNSIVYLPKLI